ncbi:MAG: hypothetical protein ACREH3_19160 [Geminicoccales bacterium]
MKLAWDIVWRRALSLALDCVVLLLALGVAAPFILILIAPFVRM